MYVLAGPAPFPTLLPEETIFEEEQTFDPAAEKKKAERMALVRTLLVIGGGAVLLSLASRKGVRRSVLR